MFYETICKSQDRLLLEEIIMKKITKKFFILLLTCMFMSSAGFLVGCSKPETSTVQPYEYPNDNVTDNVNDTVSNPQINESGNVQNPGDRPRIVDANGTVVPRDNKSLPPPDGMTPPEDTGGMVPPEDVDMRMLQSVDACVNKLEGDNCTFIDDRFEGDLYGTCTLIRGSMTGNNTASSETLSCIPDWPE
jgi:hypothetical protein